MAGAAVAEHDVMFRSAHSRFSITLGVALLAFVLALVAPAEADLSPALAAAPRH